MSDASCLFENGEGYERHMGRWSRLVGKEFLEWLDAPKAVRWLDVGCGNGAFTEEIVVRSAPSAVAAIDPSEGQLAFARTRPGTEMVEFANAGAQALPFAEAVFDVAVMALAIAFVPDPARAVREMTRVVRAGGVVATYMWDFTGGGSPLSPVVTAMRTLGLDPPSPPNPEASRIDALRGYWESAGLESIETRTIVIAVDFPTFEDFWDSNSLPLGPLGKTIEVLPASVKERLRVTLREQLQGDDGRIAFESRANAVRGRTSNG